MRTATDVLGLTCDPLRKASRQQGGQDNEFTFTLQTRLRIKPRELATVWKERYRLCTQPYVSLSGLPYFMSTSKTVSRNTFLRTGLGNIVRSSPVSPRPEAVPQVGPYTLEYFHLKSTLPIFGS